MTTPSGVAATEFDPELILTLVDTRVDITKFPLVSTITIP